MNKATQEIADRMKQQASISETVMYMVSMEGYDHLKTFIKGHQERDIATVFKAETLADMNYIKGHRKALDEILGWIAMHKKVVSDLPKNLQELED